MPGLLIRALEDSALVVTLAAAEGLGRLGVHEAVPQLILLLQRPEPELLRCVVQSLVQLGGEEARAALARQGEAQDPPAA